MVTISIRNKIIISLFILFLIIFIIAIIDFVSKEATLQYLYDIARGYDLPGLTPNLLKNWRGVFFYSK